MGRLLGKRSDVMGAAMTPHKYAAVIKAWADGAEVQYRTNGQAVWQDWVSTSYSAIPSFRDDVEWRLKPAPVKLIVGQRMGNGGSMNRHPEAGALSRRFAEHSADLLLDVDNLCWALSIVGLAALTAAWWPL